MPKDWTTQTSNDEAHARAGGRRRYNARRQREASDRRLELLKLLKAGLSNAEAGRQLGVHRSTIGRDIEADLMLNILALPRKLGRFLGKKK